MQPLSASTRSTEPPAWLRDQVYGPRRERTVALVRNSVDALLRERVRVSLASVVARSKQVDPEGRGVSESAVLGNEEARSYYARHRTWRRSTANRLTAARRAAVLADESTPASPNAAGARRYMRVPKAALVERLLLLEEAQRKQEDRWLQLNDELLIVTLRAENAERQLAAASQTKS